MAFSNPTESDLPDALLEQAAIWHARMREPDTDPARAERQRASFELWLNADTSHARAYMETEQMWGRLAAPVERIIARDAATPRGITGATPRVAAMVATLLIVLGASALWHNGIIDDLRSDRVTATGERAPLDLADGSSIMLDSDTALRVDLQANRREVRLYRGEAWFDVAKDETRPFIVETPNGSVRVTGTSFDVRIENDATVVSLASGRVELTSSAGTQPIVLEPGQQARVSQHDISDPAPYDATAVTAWRRGQLVFYDTPLETVIADINRYRIGRIFVARDDLRRLRISGVFRTDDPGAVLDVIAATLPVQVIRLTDYLVLLR